MTYENRLPSNYAFGTLSAAAAISDTSLQSAAFATAIPSGLSTTTYVPVTLQNPSTGVFEVVWINAHTAASTTVTVLRGREGTSALAWGSGTLWAVAPTLRDGVLPVTTRSALPADAHVGMRAYIIDEQVVVEKTLAQGWISTLANIRPSSTLRQTSTQGINANNAFAQPLTFDTEDFDLVSCHEPVTNPSRFTIPTGWAGKYAFTGAYSCEPNGSGGRGCIWKKNGVEILASQVMIQSVGALLNTIVPARSIKVPLAVGDYVELCPYQNSGVTLNTVAVTTAQSSMTGTYEGP